MNLFDLVMKHIDKLKHVGFDDYLIEGREFKIIPRANGDATITTYSPNGMYLSEDVPKAQMGQLGATLAERKGKSYGDAIQDLDQEISKHDKYVYCFDTLSTI